jgi:hypothetical protein
MITLQNKSAETYNSSTIWKYIRTQWWCGCIFFHVSLFLNISGHVIQDNPFEEKSNQIGEREEIEGEGEN